MNTFKPGEMAIIVRAVNNQQFVGHRCEVIKYLGDICGVKRVYDVIAPDGKDMWSQEINLRKIPPNQEAGNWDDANNVWQPESVRV